MTIEILMPKSGLTMTEGKIVEWKKNEGDWVEKGEILFVFETEKVTLEVEAQQSGFLVKIIAQIDDVVPVGGVVGLLGEKKDEQVGGAAVKPAGTQAGAEIAQTTAPSEAQEAADKIKATPMVRKLAREKGIDLRKITPSSGGRIRKIDIEKALEQAAAQPVQASEPVQAPTPRTAEGKLVKLSGMRRVIAQKMLASKTEAAQTYHVISIDATNLLQAKDKLTPVVEKKAGVRPTITDIFMKLAATAISSHPIMNTRWTKDGIVWLESIHMGMAMAVPDGLIVPVIWDMDKKSISETAKARAEVVEKGRAGKLTPDEMKGSTFTVSSLGMYGLEEFTAIINQPESAILAVGAIVDRPVVVNKEIVVRPIMKITLSYDHRVIDGAKAAEFMKTLKEITENPILIIA